MNEERAKQIVYDYEKTSKQLERKRSELRKVGEFLQLFGGRLMDKPERILFPGRTFGTDMPVELIDGPVDEVLNKEYFDREIKEIRGLVRKFEGLQQEKRKLQL